MAGILPVNGKIIRPFLSRKKSDILKIKAEYVDDSTKTNEEYSRSTSGTILPEMEHINKKATAHISGGMQMQNFSILPPKWKNYIRKGNNKGKGRTVSGRKHFMR
ncbi:MAG: hypothetical protein ACLTS6_18115 [Anaerobutyricum sp.]